MRRFHCTEAQAAEPVFWRRSLGWRLRARSARTIMATNGAPTTGRSPTKSYKKLKVRRVWTQFLESTYVGRLSTTGKIIQLPYCFFSSSRHVGQSKTSLCRPFCLDLSGDRGPLSAGEFTTRTGPRNQSSRLSNMQRSHDYVAVRGYCASDAVARTLVREGLCLGAVRGRRPLDTVKTGRGRETVVLADGAVQFDLINRRGRWQIEGFKISAENP